MVDILRLALYGVLYYAFLSYLRVLNSVYERRRQQRLLRREMSWWAARLRR